MRAESTPHQVPVVLNTVHSYDYPLSDGWLRVGAQVRDPWFSEATPADARVIKTNDLPRKHVGSPSSPGSS